MNSKIKKEMISSSISKISKGKILAEQLTILNNLLEYTNSNSIFTINENISVEELAALNMFLDMHLHRFYLNLHESILAEINMLENELISLFNQNTDGN